MQFLRFVYKMHTLRWDAFTGVCCLSQIKDRRNVPVTVVAQICVASTGVGLLGAAWGLRIDSSIISHTCDPGRSPYVQ